MELNTAMFARASRSGYVLKPKLLRTKGAEKDKSALVRSERYIFELEVSVGAPPKARIARSPLCSSSDHLGSTAPSSPRPELLERSGRRSRRPVHRAQRLPARANRSD